MDRISFRQSMLIMFHLRLNGILIPRPMLSPLLTFSLLAFGFLAGKEVKAAGVSNLGLRDREPCFCPKPTIH